MDALVLLDAQPFTTVCEITRKTRALVNCRFVEISFCTPAVRGTPVSRYGVNTGCKRGNSEYFKLHDGWQALGKRADGFWYSISDITSIDSSKKTVRVDYVNFQDGDVEEPWVDVRIIVPLTTDASAEKFTVCTIKDKIKDTVETILVQYKKSDQANTFIGGINGKEFTCEFDPKYGVKEVEMRRCTRRKLLQQSYNTMQTHHDTRAYVWLCSK